MITDYFSPEEGVVSSKVRRKKYLNCIITFSNDLFKGLNLKEIGSIKTCSTKYPVCELAPDTIVFLSPITSALAGGALEEIIQKYDPIYIFSFGSCGTLNKSDINSTLIVPTMAYRDEGFSYHYAPPEDFIQCYPDCLTTQAGRMGIPVKNVPVWTTDAMYRETPTKIKLFRDQMGIGAVEMECAGLQAVCNFRNKRYFPVFFPSDFVSENGWENEHLSKSTQTPWHELCFQLILSEIDRHRKPQHKSRTRRRGHR